MKKHSKYIERCIHLINVIIFNIFQYTFFFFLRKCYNDALSLSSLVFAASCHHTVLSSNLAGPTWGPQGPARAQKGKVSNFFFLSLFIFYQNVPNMVEHKSKLSFLKHKKNKSRIVGQSWEKKKIKMSLNLS